MGKIELPLPLKPCHTTTFLSKVLAAFVKFISEHIVEERLKKLRKSSIRWHDCFHACTVFQPSSYRSCTAHCTQSTFLLRPTTFSCTSYNVLDDLHPPVHVQSVGSWRRSVNVAVIPGFSDARGCGRPPRFRTLVTGAQNCNVCGLGIFPALQALHSATTDVP